jgi:23S rRNA (guanosine2251-2'-O)-methyltransferase
MSFNRRENAGIIAGLRPLVEALRSGSQIDKVLIQAGLRGELYQEVMTLVKQHNLIVQYVPAEKLNKLTRIQHQGVIAFVSPVEFHDLGETLENLSNKGKEENFLMLDSITDVRNFGAICRSAECFGVRNIIVPEQGSSRISEDSMKTSAGALAHMHICKVSNLVDALLLLQQYGYETIACSEKGADKINEIKAPSKWCLVMGSEEKGISPTVLKRVSQLVQIPMTGRTESLNVSVAAGIALFALSKH